MNTTTARIALRRARRTVPFSLLFQSVVGFSMLAITLYGATGPLFGSDDTLLATSVVAAVGAVLGAVLAIKG